MYVYNIYNNINIEIYNIHWLNIILYKSIFSLSFFLAANLNRMENAEFNSIFPKIPSSTGPMILKTSKDVCFQWPAGTWRPSNLPLEVEVSLLARTEAHPVRCSLHQTCGVCAWPKVIKKYFGSIPLSSYQKNFLMLFVNICELVNINPGVITP